MESALLIWNLQFARKLTPVSRSVQIKLGEVESSFRVNPRAFHCFIVPNCVAENRNVKSNWIWRCCSRRRLILYRRDVCDSISHGRFQLNFFFLCNFARIAPLFEESKLEYQSKTPLPIRHFIAFRVENIKKIKHICRIGVRCTPLAH